MVRLQRGPECDGGDFREVDRAYLRWAWTGAKRLHKVKRRRDPIDRRSGPRRSAGPKPKNAWRLSRKKNRHAPTWEHTGHFMPRMAGGWRTKNYTAWRPRPGYSDAKPGPACSFPGKENRRCLDGGALGLAHRDGSQGEGNRGGTGNGDHRAGFKREISE